jgi:hypothetical protein
MSIFTSRLFQKSSNLISNPRFFRLFFSSPQISVGNNYSLCSSLLPLDIKHYEHFDSIQSIESIESPSFIFPQESSIPLNYNLTNRNAREPRRNNQGARPCSSVRRRRKIKRRANDHPFIPLHRSRRPKGYDI